MGLLFFLYVLMPVISSGLIVLACWMMWNKNNVGEDGIIKLLLESLTNQKKIMATLQELSVKVDALQTALDNEQEQIRSAIDALTAEVEKLRTDVVEGGTAEERQQLADRLDAIKSDLESTIPDEPTEPTEPEA